MLSMCTRFSEIQEGYPVSYDYFQDLYEILESSMDQRIKFLRYNHILQSGPSAKFWGMGVCSPILRSELITELSSGHSFARTRIIQA